MAMNAMCVFFNTTAIQTAQKIKKMITLVLTQTSREQVREKVYMEESDDFQIAG